MRFVGFMAVVMAWGAVVTDAEAQNELLYIIYDSSNSMWGELEDQSRKYEAGRRAIGPALASATAGRDLALRAYGHREAGDCRDSELIVQPAAADTARAQIETAVNGIRPTGKTPISYSLGEALKDFGDRDGDILLISDGIETCDMDPCALMYDWREQGIKIRVHVVGVGLNDVERQSMTCIAEAGGGQYFDAGSEVELQAAVSEASDIAPGDPAPVPAVQGYALIIQGVDETGRSFLTKGKLIKDGEPVSDVTSNGRNVIAEPGDYEIEVGPVLRDGTIYKPVRKGVAIERPGETRVTVQVTRPAIVSASFTEKGESVRGSGVSVWQEGAEVFRFRPFDEVLARPGEYDFKASPNADNELTVTETLIEGEQTVIAFQLLNTVQVRFRYVLPNGETDQRNGGLFRNDELRYSTYGGRFATVLPGEYELRDRFSDPLNPLTPQAVEISDEEEQIIDVSMPAGYIKTGYDGEDRDFHNRGNTRVFIHALDPATGESLGSITSATNRIEVAKPGRYRVDGHAGGGYFDPVEVAVAENETVTATLMAKPTADVSVTYAPSDYEREPDRAFLYPLDGQEPHQSFMRPGTSLKVPPGRYRIDPHNAPGVNPIEVDLQPGETRELVFQ